MNIVFFRFYIILVLILLLIFAFFISKQLLSFVVNNIKLNYLVDNLKRSKIVSIDYSNIFNYYLYNGRFFISICLLEFLLESKFTVVNNEIIYLDLAYLYNKKSFYSIAEYYYFKNLSSLNCSQTTLLSLNKMYNFIGHQEV